MGDLDTLGFLFEALYERDLRIYAESFGGRLYHYQDYRGFEIRLDTNQIDAAAEEGLLRIRRAFEKDLKGKPPAVFAYCAGWRVRRIREQTEYMLCPLPH